MGTVDTNETKTRLELAKDACQDFLENLQKSDPSHFVSLIAFSNTSKDIVTLQPEPLPKASQSIPERLGQLKPSGDTYYIPALDAVDKVLGQLPSGKTVQKPVVFFLSDGEALDGNRDEIVPRVKKLADEHAVVVNTCLYGSETKGELLMQMPFGEKGQFYLSPTGQKLREQLEEFRASLIPPLSIVNS
jgi:Mg-chelatase subunit ChlD